jgi:[ribosomal protein S5]-alanine N-acetyltransferase
VSALVEGMTMDMAMPALETDRLLIRPFIDADLPAVRAVLEEDGTDPATERYVRHGGPNAAVLAALQQPPFGDRAVVLRATGELIGLAGLVPAYGPFDQVRLKGDTLPEDPPASLYRVEMGLFYHVHPGHRGRGYATEAARALVEFAFGRLLVARIVATTDHDNVASQAVMLRLGMRLHQNAREDPPWLQVVGILENQRQR